MKALLIASMIMAAGTLAAQPPHPMDPSIRAAIVAQSHDIAIADMSAKPNEIKGSRVTYSGVGVQVLKAKNKWQLINPFAPAEYGKGSANLDRDIITGKDTGFKFFSISW